MRVLAPSLIALLLLGACASEDDPFTIRLIPIKTTALDSCGDVSPQDLTEELSKGSHRLRYTFLRRGEKVGPRTMRQFDLHCYRVVPENASQEFLVPLTTDGTPLSLFVEAFDVRTEKIDYTGLVHEVDLKSNKVDVYLYPSRALGCGKATRPQRAFHSSTLLPNGEVLMIGGFASSGGDLVDAIISDDKALLFDPDTLTFTYLTPSDPLLARAFHQAVLLPSPAAGPYQLLLVGGAMATNRGPVARRRNPNSQFFKCGSDDCVSHFSYLPHEDATPAGAAIVTYTPAAGDAPASFTVAPVEGLSPSVFPQLALDASGEHALVVGGANRYNAESAATQGFEADTLVGEWLTLESVQVQQVGVASLRAGHALAPLGDRFLLLGGNMDGPAATLADRQAEWGDVTSFSATAAQALVPLAWHTLTPLGVSDRDLANGINPGELIYAGGFPLSKDDTATYSSAIPNRATLRPNPFSRLRLQNFTLSELSSSATTTFRAAGYHTALRLHDGSVMLAGGNFQDLCELPGGEDPLLTIFCPSDALAVLAPGVSDVAPRSALPTALKRRRYGHRATRLLDNTVLISGGVSIGAGGRSTLEEVWEILSPHDYKIDDHPLLVRRNGQLMLSNAMVGNNAADGACLLRSGTDQESSAMKTPTSPLPRERMRRRIRSVRFELAPRVE